jgi:hypothetical protein
MSKRACDNFPLEDNSVVTLAARQEFNIILRLSMMIATRSCSDGEGIPSSNTAKARKLESNNSGVEHEMKHGVCCCNELRFFSIRNSISTETNRDGEDDENLRGMRTSCMPVISTAELLRAALAK